jgi:hypothetical protein
MFICGCGLLLVELASTVMLPPMHCRTLSLLQATRPQVELAIIQQRQFELSTELVPHCRMGLATSYVWLRLGARTPSL